MPQRACSSDSTTNFNAMNRTGLEENRQCSSQRLNAPKTPAGRDLLFTGHRSKRCHAYTLHRPGQGALVTSGNIAADFAAQCRQTLLKLKAQLRVAGMSFDNVVKLQTILPDLADIGELRAFARRSWAIGSPRVH